MKAAILAALLAATVAAQKQPVTFEFATQQANSLYNSVWYDWVGKHSLLMADGAGGYQVLDAETDKRTPFGNPKALAKDLQDVGAPHQDSMPEPDAVSPDGKWLAFIFDKTLFLLKPVSNLALKVNTAQDKVENLDFSPDSKSLGFVKDHDLYAFSLVKHKATRLSSDGKSSLLNGVLTWMYWEEIYNHHDQAYWWSPDSKYIAFLRTDESNVPPSYIIDFRQQYPELHTQCYPKPGNPNPKVDLRIVGAEGGRSASLDPLKDEDGYVVGVKWETRAEDRLLFQVMNRAQTKVTIEESAPSGGARVCYSEQHTAPMDVDDDYDYLGDGANLLFASDKSSYEHLYLAASPGAEPLELTPGNWQALPGETWDPNSVAYIDREAKQIYFTCDKDSFLERQLYRVSFDGQGLQRITKEAGTHDSSFSPDGKFFVDSYSNWARPLPKTFARMTALSSKPWPSPIRRSSTRSTFRRSPTSKSRHGTASSSPPPSASRGIWRLARSIPSS